MITSTATKGSSMIFQHTWEKVLSGQKTQTRRLFRNEAFDANWGPSGVLVNAGMCNSAVIDEGEMKDIVCVFAANSDDGRLYDENFKCKRRKWVVGSAYPVQPGRGEKSVGRIQITGIRLEDVRQISEGDAKAEGFKSIDDFLATWVMMHDKSMNIRFDNRIPGGFWTFKHASAWDGCDYGMLPKVLNKRPSQRYQAWVIEFKLIKAAA